MGVPATLDDLDPIAANNSPSGSDPIGTNLDDYLRSHAALIKKASTVIPSGTRMPFAQAAAPTGWTQDISDNATNRMLRVVNTAGGGVGGSDSPIANDIIVSHSHTLNINTGAMSANASHAHTDTGHSHVTPIMSKNNSGIVYDGYVVGGSGGLGNINWTSNAGNAAIAAANTDHIHNVVGTTAATGAWTGWRPRYIDMIICAKN